MKIFNPSSDILKKLDEFFQQEKLGKGTEKGTIDPKKVKDSRVFDGSKTLGHYDYEIKWEDAPKCSSMLKVIKSLDEIFSKTSAKYSIMTTAMADTCRISSSEQGKSMRISEVELIGPNMADGINKLMELVKQTKEFDGILSGPEFTNSTFQLVWTMRPTIVDVKLVIDKIEAALKSTGAQFSITTI